MSILSEAMAHAVTPPPDMTVDEWADANRILPQATSSEPGPWRTSRFPFLREIMQELSPSSTAEKVVFMKSSQVGGTEIDVNLMGFVVDVAPAPMMYVLPTIDTVEKFSKQRLATSIMACPSLRAKIVDSSRKFKDADSNTILIKSFPGGILILAGANSGPALRAFPIQYLMLDEIDAYVQNLQEEGDPVSIAEARTRNFARRKIYYSSSPKIRETSRIEPLFEEGDQRFFHVPCPFCGTTQRITWDRIKWTDRNPETTRLECVACNKLIEERHKTEMLEHGYWKPTYPSRPIASFHLSALYSPLGFYKWSEAVAMFLRAKTTNNKEIYQSFVNTVLGETYTLEGKALDASVIMQSHKHEYKERVPKEVLIMTAGVDVQDDRIEAEIVGWGMHEESWSVDYRVILGDTEGKSVWDELDMYLQMSFKHESGVMLGIAAASIDSGHRAKVVYGFCGSKKGQYRAFPMKGREGFGNGYVRRGVHKNEYGVWLHILFSDEVKSKISSNLRVDEHGPGFCHFPELPAYSDAYFKGLTSETLVTKKVDGRSRLYWHLPKGRRNEPLDCRALAIGAREIFSPNMELILASGQPYGPTSAISTVVGSKTGRRVLSRGVRV